MLPTNVLLWLHSSRLPRNTVSHVSLRKALGKNRTVVGAPLANLTYQNIIQKFAGKDCIHSAISRRRPTNLCPEVSNVPDNLLKSGFCAVLCPVQRQTLGDILCSKGSTRNFTLSTSTSASRCSKLRFSLTKVNVGVNSPWPERSKRRVRAQGPGTRLASAWPRCCAKVRTNLPPRD